MAKGYSQAVERDAGRCRGCGKAYTQVHHIQFRSQGGSDEADNLVCLCDRCHRRAHGLEHDNLSARMLRAALRTNGNADGFRLKIGLCYSCAWVIQDPLGRTICDIWETEVDPDYGCNEWQSGSHGRHQTIRW